MQYTLRKAMGEILEEDENYIRYYRRMIRDYESGNWFFDIRILVKLRAAEVNCPYIFSKRGYRRQICLCVTDFDEFKKQFEKYYNEYLKPQRVIRENLILARKIWNKKYGYISRINQNCQEAGLDCSKCKDTSDCDLFRNYTGKEPHVKYVTKMLTILYGNIRKGHFAKMSREKNKEC